MLFNHHIWLQLFTLFIFYANKSTKSHVNQKKMKMKQHHNKAMTPKKLVPEKCPAIPRCQWGRFEELQLKVQQGAQSSVSMMIDQFNNEPVIRKIFSDKSDFLNEMKTLSCIRVGHNPLLVYPLCVDPLKMIMVLEWAGDGDLTNWNLFRHETVRYSYADVVKVSAQIVASVAAAHRRGFLHGDIKPENFVIDIKRKMCKLIDFGLSAKLGDYRVMSQGTPQTMAPEVAFIDFFPNRLQNGPFGLVDEELIRNMADKPQYIREAMDWWSVGVTIHYLFAKFFEEDANRIKQQVVDSIFQVSSSDESDKVSEDQTTDSETDSDSEGPLKVNFSESDDHYFPYKIKWSSDGRDILSFNFYPKPAVFPPSLINLLNLLMSWDPEKRNFGSKRLMREVLRHEFFEKIDWNEIDANLMK